MKKAFRTIGICILVIILLIFGKSYDNRSTIKVGLLADITGRASLLGVSGRNGLQLAVDEYNQGDNPYRIRLVIKDDKGLKDEMKKVVKEFNQEGVQLIIGPYTSNIATEIVEAQINISNDFLFISPTVSSSDITNIDDNFITLIAKNEEQGILLAQKAYNDGLTKMATIYEYNNRSYSQPVVEAFEETFTRLGGKIVYSNWFTSSEDAPFQKLSEELVATKAEGVLIVAGGLDASQLTQFIHKKQPNIQIFCGMWAKTLDFITNGGKAIEGAYLASISEEVSVNESYNEFNQQYIEKYNSNLTFPAVCTYEAAQLLFEAIEQSDNKNIEEIKNAIIKSKYSGLSNDFSLNMFGDSDRPYVLFKVKEGKYIKVTE